jgi:AcrR family transcriptional regulator
VSSYHHGDLRSALVQAGLGILDREGIEALGVRAVARSVGVSHAAPVRHFPDRAALIAAIATVAYDDLADAMLAARDAADNPALAFRATGLAYIDFALEHPQRFRVLAHPAITDISRDPDLARASDRAFDVLRDAIVAAADAGVTRSDDISAIALTAWSTVHGLATLALDNQLTRKGFHAQMSELAPLVLDELFRGVGRSATMPDT